MSDHLSPRFGWSAECLKIDKINIFDTVSGERSSFLININDIYLLELTLTK